MKLNRYQISEVRGLFYLSLSFSGQIKAKYKHPSPFLTAFQAKNAVPKLAKALIRSQFRWKVQ